MGYYSRFDTDIEVDLQVGVMDWPYHDERMSH